MATARPDNDLKARSSDLKGYFLAERGQLRVKAKTEPSGGFDTTAPEHTEPGYTLRFVFHGATNLPVADFHSSSADPFVHATLTTDLPRRHKEDPVFVHRTRTVHRSTAPTWEDVWVVANVPSSGFRLKCRLYDEDATDHDDRLGNVTYEVASIGQGAWTGLERTSFAVKKRMASKRAYLFKTITALLLHHSVTTITPMFDLSIQLLGRSNPPGGRMYTLGQTTWIRHFSPMIGRLTHTRVNRDEHADESTTDIPHSSSYRGTSADRHSERQTKKYDFQANEIQLCGPVPEQLYHRYVAFRPIIGRMFSAHGIRGRIFNIALHKQHNRVYNFGPTTEYGTFEPCSEQASLQLLKLAHFDEGGRIFTYMLSLDGVLRFTETGKEFGIDLLSKHTMHSDVATYIAFSGEFFIRRLHKPTIRASEPVPSVATHPVEPIPGGPPFESQPHQPIYYQLIIDNDSGTYRPDKSLLPLLKRFLEHNFPGLGIVAMHWEDETLQTLKKDQLRVKKCEGPGVNMVLNRSPSAGSFSSSDESRLSALGHGDSKNSNRQSQHHRKFRNDLAWDLVEDPSRIKDLRHAISVHDRV